MKERVLSECQPLSSYCQSELGTVCSPSWTFDIQPRLSVRSSETSQWPCTAILLFSSSENQNCLTVVENVEISVSLPIHRSSLKSLGCVQSISPHGTRVFLGSLSAAFDCYVAGEVWNYPVLPSNQLVECSVPSSEASNRNFRVLSDLQPLSVYCQPLGGIVARPFTTLLIKPLLDLGLDPTIQDPRPATQITQDLGKFCLFGAILGAVSQSVSQLLSQGFWFFGQKDISSLWTSSHHQTTQTFNFSSGRLSFQEYIPRTIW